MYDTASLTVDRTNATVHAEEGTGENFAVSGSSKIARRYAYTHKHLGVAAWVRENCGRPWLHEFLHIQPQSWKV